MFNLILDIITKHDPIGIAHEEDPEEYGPEAKAIAAAFSPDMSLEELTTMIHKIFIYMFDDLIAGPQERYHGIASDLFTATHTK